MKNFDGWADGHEKQLCDKKDKNRSLKHLRHMQAYHVRRRAGETMPASAHCCKTSTCVLSLAVIIFRGEPHSFFGVTCAATLQDQIWLVRERGIPSHTRVVVQLRVWCDYIYAHIARISTYASLLREKSTNSSGQPQLLSYVFFWRFLQFSRHRPIRMFVFRNFQISVLNSYVHTHSPYWCTIANYVH